MTMGGSFGGQGGPYSYETLALKQQIAMLKEELAKHQAAVGENMVRLPVLSSNDKFVICMYQGAEMEIPANPALKPRMGDMVRVRKDLTGIVDCFPMPPHAGAVFKASADAAGGMVEVYNEQVKRMVHVPPDVTVKLGDRVLVDDMGRFVYQSLGREDSAYAFSGDNGITWDDVGGLEEQKRLLRDAIETPYQHPDIYKAYGYTAPSGALLYGPPGTGKTMLAKAAASSLAKTHGAKAAATGFLYVKGPELLSKWVGATESNIRELFQRAREHMKAHGYPALLFIDEADALLPKRGRQSGISGMETTVVPQFLAEMDGLGDKAAFVLLSTNIPAQLDPAVVRDKRIDLKIAFTRPDEKDAVKIAALYLKNKPVGSDMNRDELAAFLAARLYDQQHTLYTITLKDKTTKPFRLGHLASGAMIANAVSKATDAAILRDVSTKAKKPTGISRNDVASAVGDILRENLDVDHTEAVTAFVEPFRDSVVSFERAKKAVTL